MPTKEARLACLRKAYTEESLTLYLGAGVSVGNGLPTWEQLVLAMYFSAINEQSLHGWRPFPNYLFAIAEWHLRRTAEPLEITARKIRKYYENQDVFLKHVRQTLYAGFLDSYDADPGMDHRLIREANSTLRAVAELCEHSRTGRGRVRAVITYNYDSLLETALEPDFYQSVWNVQPLQTDRLPIYHVHGFVPVEEGGGSTAEELIFTEDQYHLAAQDPYAWANLVQIQSLSSSTGLMIGLSLADRNLRRLLDAIRNAPIRTENYAFLQEPEWTQPDDNALQQIHEKAQAYLDRFERSGVKRGGVKGPSWQEQILGIIQEVERLGVEQQTFVLEQLGICPIWYKNHSEIPDLLAAVTGAD